MRSTFIPGPESSIILVIYCLIATITFIFGLEFVYQLQWHVYQTDGRSETGTKKATKYDEKIDSIYLS